MAVLYITNPKSTIFWGTSGGGSANIPYSARPHNSKEVYTEREWSDRNHEQL